MTVAFFGHSDAPSEVYPLLERKIAELAEQNSEVTFLVGTHGAFDRMAQKALEQAVKRYPHIRAYIVLAYYEPTPKEEYKLPTLLPEGIENVPKRWSIEYRNKFMVNECAYDLRSHYRCLLCTARLGRGVEIRGNGEEKGEGNRKSFGNRCVTVQH